MKKITYLGILMACLLALPTRAETESAIFIDVLGEAQYTLNGQPTSLDDMLAAVRSIAQRDQTNLVYFVAHRKSTKKDLTDLMDVMKNQGFKLLLTADNSE